MKVQFSIPAYRSVIHTATSLCFADFLLKAKAKGWDIGYYCPDSCDVDYAQNMILKRAFESEQDVCLMIGSDNHAPGSELIRMIETLMASGDTSAIAAPCQHRGGGLNVGADTPEQERATLHALKERTVHRPDRIGFGIVAFQLAWYREHWPKGEVWLRSKIYFDGDELVRESQDYVHCYRVKELGGMVLMDSRVTTGHEIAMFNKDWGEVP